MIRAATLSSLFVAALSFMMMAYSLIPA